MSLPSGYKRLEYIKSSGTQYIDSGIQPTQNTRIDLKVSTTQTGSHTIAGSDISWTGNGFGIGVGFAHYGTQTASINGMNDGSVHDISLNKNVLSVDGEVKHTFSSQTFSVGYNLMLFANNRSGSKEELTEATWYSCKIYDNDTIIRDYIPCQTNTGEIGLWDDANGQLISEQDSTSYTDNVKLFETIQYSVSAYNEYGECEPTSITFYATPDNPVLYLITDRTSADVSRARELAKKLNAGTATVEELAEWNSMALKGCYDLTDLNRVGFVVDYLSELLKANGYAVSTSPKLDWTEMDWKEPSTADTYLANVSALRNALPLYSTTPAVPSDTEKLTTDEANAIEQILKDLDTTIKTMLKIRVSCGDANCGGDYL